MYESFFGLNSSPFQLSPDPFFLVPSEKGKEALASISEAIRQRKGFVVLTGEVGTGKTLLLRCLIESLEREEISFAYFIGPKLSALDFLSYIAFELGLDVTQLGKGDLLRTLYVFLLTQFEKGRTTVLIIDEAHQIPRRVLEEIRLLTNFETAQQKLVQIVLVGQPELDNRLDQAELRSLKQRIAVRCQLEPLSEDETRPYIERRLEVAGAGEQAAAIFPSKTIREIYRYSHGIPRLVNSICDQALIASYTRGVRVVPVEFITDIATLFRLDPTPNTTPRVSQLSAPNKKRSGAQQESSRTEPVPPAAHENNAYLNSTLRNLYIAHGTPFSKAKPQGKPEDSDEKLLRDNSIAYEANLTQKGDAAVTAEKVSPVFKRGSTFLPESIFPVRETALIIQPEIGQKARSIVNPRSSDQVDEISPIDERSSIRAKIRSRLRTLLIVGVFAAAILALAAGYLVARNQTMWMAALVHRVADTAETLPEKQNMLSIQPVEASAAVKVEVNSVQPEPRANSPTTSPRNTHKDSWMPSKGFASRLSKPARKSSSLSVPSEPLSIANTQTAELDVGEGIFGTASPRPARPSSNASNLQPPKLVSSIPATYPSFARLADIGGAVLIDAVVDEMGNVSHMNVISGASVLRQAAMESLRKWKYQPAVLDGQAVEAHVQVKIDFVPH